MYMKKSFVLFTLLIAVLTKIYSYGAPEVFLSADLLTADGKTLPELSKYAENYNLNVIIDEIEINESNIVQSYIRIRDREAHNDEDSIYRLSYIVNVIGNYYKKNMDVYRNSNKKVIYIEKMTIDGDDVEYKGYVIEKNFYDSYIPMTTAEQGSYINNTFKNEIYRIPNKSTSPLW